MAAKADARAADLMPIVDDLRVEGRASRRQLAAGLGRMVTNTTAGKLAPALVWGGQDGPDDNRVVMKDGAIQNQTI